MSLLTALARLLIFPGILFAVPAAWLFLWVERKSVAMMQGRIGPPFMQPFFDFVKLLVQPGRLVAQGLKFGFGLGFDAIARFFDFVGELIHVMI